jgi:hypothetical protein
VSVKYASEQQNKIDYCSNTMPDEWPDTNHASMA